MSDEELAKDLGLLSALTIGIGTMIGAGIFVLPGTAVERAGPFAILTFVIGGVIAIFTALSASELGTAMPKSGGAYFYVNRALGPLFGSVTGWANWFGLAFASAFYMYGMGEYINTFAGLGTLAVGPVTFQPAQIIGFFGALFFIGVNYMGAKETGGLQIIIVGLLVGILSVFSVVGLLNADPGAVTQTSGTFGEILPVTAIVFVSYLGFVQITSVAEEIKDPGRNLPIAVIGSVVIVTVIYALFLLVLLAAVPNELVSGNDTAVVDASELLFGQYEILGFSLASFGYVMLLIGGLLATASSANASILSSSRINFAMGREKIVTPALNEIHPRFSTPYRSIALTGALILLFLLAGNLELLATAGSVLHLIVYGLLNLALIVMREAEPAGYEPDFEVPLYPIVPIIGAVFSFALIVYIEPAVIIFCIGFVAFAALWYFFYARQRVETSGVLSSWVLERPEEMPDFAVSAAEVAAPDAAGSYDVMVPVANPRTEDELIALGATLAKQNDGTVHAVHIVSVPDQTSLESVSDKLDSIDPETDTLMQGAREMAAEYDVDLETHTVVSHRPFDEIFDSARRLSADSVVMGWSERSPWTSGRTSGALESLTTTLPCDFLVFKDRGLDFSRVLLPTAGGPDSDLSAEAAKALRDVHGSEVSILHIVDEATDRAKGMSFIGDWADDHGLGDAELLVEATDDVEGAIERAAAEHSLLLMGATREGLLSRLFSDSLVFDVVDDVDCSVLLSERPGKRSLRERLFGGSTEKRSAIESEEAAEDQPAEADD